MKKLMALLLTAVMALSLFPTFIFAAEESAPWWEEDIWEEDVLLSLGAILPVYNQETQQYEISSPEQLLYMSGLWKTGDSNGDGVPDAPCDGTYVLTADLDMAPLMARIGETLTALTGTETEGYMPPIGASADKQADEGVHCAFFGRFDGQFHTVSNLTVKRFKDKHAGFFGNIGHDNGEGYVKNLAVININVTAKASAGLLASGIYGDVENCVLIGTINCEEKTVGGLAGKIKKNDKGFISTVKNCFVWCDSFINGQGSENGAAGGITSANSDGGMVFDCFAGGSIKVVGRKAESVGGISGNLKSSQGVGGTVMALSSIEVEEGTGIGLFAGDFSGENGSHIERNYVYEGTYLTGNPADVHPAGAAYGSCTAADLKTLSFYKDTVGWDFENAWAWVGDEAKGYPMVKGFENTAPALFDAAAAMDGSLQITRPILRASEPMSSSCYEGETGIIGATLLLPEGQTVSGVTLHYGTEKDGSTFAAAVPMEAGENGTYTAVFPETAAGTFYYYLQAETAEGSVTFPANISRGIRYEVLSQAARLTPMQFTLTPGKTFESMGLAFVTELPTASALLRYRVKGTQDWTEQEVTEIYTAELPGDKGSRISYSADLTGLLPDTAYEYHVLCKDEAGENYLSATNVFTTLPEKAVSFIVISDLQSTTEEGYLPFQYTMSGFLKDKDVDFVLNLGDLTEDGASLAQWDYMFNTLKSVYASTPTIFIPGNHESKGDPTATLFKAGTNLPNVFDDPVLGEQVGAYIVGDACIVTMNTEPYSGNEGADVEAERHAFYEAQKAWAKEMFEQSGCKYRIVAAHAGLIQDDAWCREFLMAMCDELQVDLFFNGHIHNYYRASARDGQKAEAGTGTTFITTSPMGMKFDDFSEGVCDELIEVQVGGSFDERQYFTYVQIDENGVNVTAYQRTVEGNSLEKKSYKEYTVIDSVTLTDHRP